MNESRWGSNPVEEINALAHPYGPIGTKLTRPELRELSGLLFWAQNRRKTGINVCNVTHK
jgi:hypothetical protein